MNQMLQDTETKTPENPAPPPLPPTHPRFAKPQRVAFVQSSWHRDVVLECQAFGKEISHSNTTSQCQDDCTKATRCGWAAQYGPTAAVFRGFSFPSCNI